MGIHLWKCVCTIILIVNLTLILSHESDPVCENQATVGKSNSDVRIKVCNHLFHYDVNLKDIQGYMRV